MGILEQDATNNSGSFGDGFSNPVMVYNIWVYYWVCHIMPELTADNQYGYGSKSMFMAIPYCFGIEHSYFYFFFRTLIFRELQVCRVSTCTYIQIYGVK